MNIIYKCKCGRTTTYGLRCVACSGSTFDFVGFKEEIEETEEESDPEVESDDD